MGVDYQSMRTFADSWGLLYMFLIFCGVIFFALRPRVQKQIDDAARIPFKED